MSRTEGSTITEANVGRDWFKSLSQYEKPLLHRAVRQLINTVLPYVGLWAAMVWMLRSGLPYWSVLPLIVFAAGFLVRVFIIFHDCCHSSFFASRTANKVVGYLMGLLAFTPYEAWQHPHNLHHATSGDLDRRGTGDVWTMTVEEYEASPWHIRAVYRVFRHPLVLFIISPTVLFLISHRFWRMGAPTRERWSVLRTNLGLATVSLIACLTMGWGTFLIIQLPILAITASVGVWLFYVQHQYEEVYWARHSEWDPARAALEGSSYYKLPRVLEWFTGNIGYHYLHHLRPRIPNYRLRQCTREMPVEPATEPLTFWASFKCMRLALWNEAEKKLVSFPRPGSRKMRSA